MSIAILTSGESGANSLIDINANFADLDTTKSDLISPTFATSITGSYLTASEILITDGSKNIVSASVVTYPSLTELTYLKGVTSAIQTQLGTKAPSTAPTFATSITGSYLTASEMLITDVSKNIVSAPVATYPSLTELSYVKGLSSAIQTQLNGKEPTKGADDNYVTDAQLIVIGNTSGTNTGDNSVNTLYSGLVTNATHTGDATGSGALTVVAINGTNLAALGTGLLKNTTTTGVPFISKVALTEPANSATLTITDAKTLSVSNSLTLAGTDSTTMTFPATTASIARIDAAQTFAGLQSFALADVANGGFYLKDAGGTYKIQVYVNETNTATRTLYLKLNNVNRNIDLTGDLTVPSAATVSGTNTGDNAANSSSTYIGTTSVALNRASAPLTLAGITLTTPEIGAATGTSLTMPTAATGLILHNVADQVTNFEKFSIVWDTNTLMIKTRNGGTGTQRNIQMASENSSGSGTTFQLRAATSTFGGVNVTRTTSGTNIVHFNIDGTSTAASGVVTHQAINPTINQSSTAGYTALLINPTETTTGSGVKRLISAQIATVDKFVVDNAGNTQVLGTLDLGHATDTTISRVSAGVVAIEGINILTTAGGTLTGNITLGENTSIDLDPVGSADGKYSGICITGTAGATLAFGDLIYLAVADSRWELVDSDAVATSGTVLIGMCVLAAANDGDATKILLQGQIRADTAFPALTIGAAVYAGETPGDVQTTIPTGADAIIRVVGFALTADEMYFNPSQDHQSTVA